MSKTTKSDLVIHEINNNRYFDDSINWYCEKYLICITERSWLFLIASFLIIFLLTSVIDTYSMFPVKTDFTLIKYTDRHTDEFSVIKKLSSDNSESEQVSVAKYLAGKYVEEYESYSYDNLSYQFNFIRNNSSRKIYLSFRDFMAPENVKSPITKYQKNISRIAVISDVKLHMSNDSISAINSATIQYYVKEINRGVVSVQPIRTASLSFSLSNIKMNAAGIMPLEFTVIEYKSEIS